MRILYFAIAIAVLSGAASAQESAAAYAEQRFLQYDDYGYDNCTTCLIN